MTKVLYFNNCWFTNVGEAFIDIGGIELTKKIFGNNSNIACLSAMSDYYVKYAPKDEKKTWSSLIKTKNNILPCETFKISNYLNADYVILPGMVGTEEYLRAPSRKMVDSLLEQGCKVILLGLGGYYYNETEIKAFREYISAIKPALIMTRDNETYEFYKDFAPCVKGLDCAFWVIDTFDPRNFTDKNDYEVITFNRSNEPTELKCLKDNIARPWHMQYQYRQNNYYDTIFISDTPYDYLTLYANAKCVYTDLVHATIISLMYGVPVKYWYIDKRSQAFYALDNLSIKNNWMGVPSESLIQQKKLIEQKMQEILLK